jgi:hypothetical protein
MKSAFFLRVVGWTALVIVLWGLLTLTYGNCS